MYVTPVNRPLGGSDAYALNQGTSMAAPFGTGAVALYRALKPQAGYAILKSNILENTDKVPALAGRLVSGGRLNLDETGRNLADKRGDLNCYQMNATGMRINLCAARNRRSLARTAAWSKIFSKFYQHLFFLSANIFF
jgi:subtilisin family serine protease